MTQEINLVKLFNESGRKPIKEIWIENNCGNLIKALYGKRKSLAEDDILIIRMADG
jgi:hypothetical protein